MSPGVQGTAFGPFLDYPRLRYPQIDGLRRDGAR